jgi:hypothetical protein
MYYISHNFCGRGETSPTLESSIRRASEITKEYAEKYSELHNTLVYKDTELVATVNVRGVLYHTPKVKT